MHSRVDGYKAAITIIAAKAQANQLMTDSDLDVLRLGQNERSVVGSMAKWINTSGSSLREAEAAYRALPFKRIGAAARAKPEERDAYLALVSKAQSANEKVLPAFTAAFEIFQASLENASADDAAAILHGAEEKGKLQQPRIARLTQTRRQLLSDVSDWLKFLQTPGLQFGWDGKQVLFAKQTDVDRYQALYAKMTGDAAPADAALEEIKHQNVESLKTLQDIQKM